MPPSVHSSGHDAVGALGQRRAGHDADRRALARASTARAVAGGHVVDRRASMTGLPSLAASRSSARDGVPVRRGVVEGRQRPGRGDVLGEHAAAGVDQRDVEGRQRHHAGQDGLEVLLDAAHVPTLRPGRDDARVTVPGGRPQGRCCASGSVPVAGPGPSEDRAEVGRRSRCASARCRASRSWWTTRRRGASRRTPPSAPSRARARCASCWRCRACGCCCPVIREDGGARLGLGRRRARHAGRASRRGSRSRPARSSGTAPTGLHALGCRVVLVPALARRRPTGNRLGKGGGYYDRLLAALADVDPDTAPAARRGRARRRGARSDDVPVEPYDRPVDAVLTPSTYRRLAVDA